MSEHYYSEETHTVSDRKEYKIHILGEDFTFITDNAVFSKKYLDFGSFVLLKEFKSNAKTILDLGCGYGPIGIILARCNPDAQILMTDINNRALELANINIEINKIINATVEKSDGAKSITGCFDSVVTNPPIRAGKQTVFGFYDEAYRLLKDKGELWVVIQKKQGAPSSMKKLQNLFGNCECISKEKGYYILKSIK